MNVYLTLGLVVGVYAISIVLFVRKFLPKEQR